MEKVESAEEILRRSSQKKTIFKDKSVFEERFNPLKLPFRNKEIEDVARILSPILRGEKPRNVFIYGTTGTGKTVVMKHVSNLIRKIAKEKNSPVEIIYVNCNMKKISDTEYRMLIKLLESSDTKIPKRGWSLNEIYEALFKVLESKKHVLIIFDEIDALAKKIGTDFLYTFVRMNTELKEAVTSLVGITNDINFVSYLDGRIKSSLGEEEIIFPPYDATQLKVILRDRAKVAFSPGVIGKGTLEKCAALAAQEHGDARRALDLLSVAGEIANQRNKDIITIEDVDKAEEKIDINKTNLLVRAQPNQSKAILTAILKLSLNGEDGIQTGDAFSEYVEICKKRGLKILTQARVSNLIAELDMLGVINAKVISHGRYGRTRIIKVGFGEKTLKEITKTLNAAGFEIGVGA